MLPWRFSQTHGSGTQEFPTLFLAGSPLLTPPRDPRDLSEPVPDPWALSTAVSMPGLQVPKMPTLLAASSAQALPLLMPICRALFKGGGTQVRTRM